MNRLIRLFTKPFVPVVRVAAKPLRKLHLFIHNNHQPLRGTLVVILVVMVGALFLSQASEFAEQSREREQATQEVIRATNQQTIILCTFIIRETIENGDLDEVRQICADEIDRFTSDDVLSDRQSDEDEPPESEPDQTPTSTSQAPQASAATPQPSGSNQPSNGPIVASNGSVNNGSGSTARPPFLADLLEELLQPLQ